MRPFTILLCATCLIGCSGDGTPTSTASNEWYIKWLNVSWEPEREFVAEFELLDRREVDEESWAHLAVSNDQVIVRSLNAISAYRWN